MKKIFNLFLFISLIFITLFSCPVQGEPKTDLSEPKALPKRFVQKKQPLRESKHQKKKVKKEIHKKAR